MDRRLLPASLALAGATAAAWRRARRRRPAVTAIPSVEPRPAPGPGPAAREPRSTSFASLAWQPVDDPPDPAASALRIRFALPAAATAPARIDVRETPSHVIVTVLARCDPAPAADGVPQEATVALAQPLGDRTLVHPPHDDAPEDPPGPRRDRSAG